MEVSNVIFPGRKEDDLIDFESMYTVVKRLGIRNYRPSHSETCKRIWKELVPKTVRRIRYKENYLDKLRKQIRRK